MIGKFGLGLGLALFVSACAPPLRELHAQAAKDFQCPESHGLIDTRTEAKPVKFGSSERMSIQGCGHKAIYHWDSAKSLWVREPDATPSALSAK